MPVLTSMIAVAAVGLLMGLKFKVPILIAATTVLLIASLAWNRLGLPGDMTVTRFLVLAFALACAYLVGLLLSAGFRRDRN